MCLSLTSLNKSILLDFDCLVDTTELKFWIERFVPSVKISNSEKFKTEEEFKIHCINDIGEPRIKFHTLDEICLYYDWSKSTFGYLGKFVSQVFQSLLIEEGVFFLPGACVCRDKKAILYVGDYWQGKTSIAMGMIQEPRNLLISDNVVAFDGEKVLGGTKYVSFRKENSRHVLYTKRLTNRALEVNGRDFFNLGDSNKIAKQNVKLVAVVNAHINKGDNNIHKVPTEEALWYLNSKFSGLIKGDVLLFDGQIPSPSLDTEVGSLKRLNMVRNLLKNLELIYMSAPLDEIVGISNKIFINKNV